MKNLAFFDVDRTIRKGSAALDYCHFLVNKGVIEDTFSKADSHIREKYKQGLISYQEMVEGVVTLHASSLSGIDTQLLLSHQEDFLKETNGLFGWTKDCFTYLQTHNVQTILVSAGIGPAIEAVAHYLHADRVFASELEIVNCKYTGNATQILHDHEKKLVVRDYIQSFNEDIATLGFGDSTGDISMLELLQHAFIIDPHQPEIIAIAKERSWEVIRGNTNPINSIEKYLQALS